MTHSFASKQACKDEKERSKLLFLFEKWRREVKLKSKRLKKEYNTKWLQKANRSIQKRPSDTTEHWNGAVFREHSTEDERYVKKTPAYHIEIERACIDPK